jgi:uncharacterized protein YukE
MKGTFDMASNHVATEFDALGSNAGAINDISHTQQTAMQGLGQMLEGLGISMQGRAGNAMQTLGAELQDEGNQIASLYQEHSYLMNQNKVSYENQELDNANIVGQILGMH